ncbi:MAG: hydrogenase nickel incorporation protein HypB [Candidatus Competibacteraceae bacterium]|uniref:Hydrogenase maturation factor HypB n=1 Tax=Candidatus Contendobacter odensis Run_B_J11 TaxID=1400861 RepID=A0A7U7GB22_9GAMM|nr:hydrogenase nickel incorporation protein HypB [Candidatus Contendobacter odensis]MBK8534837.1 hydrogenase nickel incorporation protein HypB [Candidatus Competibacteraceae bacterium]CDH44468.1 GTP hydrolase involved in nickel liganding into hydrogenases [Candidatus Contendobacter odensis Run_B_J11]
MCNTCGCNLSDGNRHLLSPPLNRGASGSTPEKILNGLLEHNDRQARINRARLDAQGVLTINLMSSPGSGKTSLLEATIRVLEGRLRIGVIEGDLETENDADRIRALGVPAHQITTGTACHLDAHLIHGALDQLDLAQLDILFIENVGNLVCPASFDLGHHRNVILLSVTEGDDKPAKYPVMFRAADLMLISKTDLLPYLPEFSPDRAERCLRHLASMVPTLHLSARSGAGVADWIEWLAAERDGYCELLNRHQTLTPRVESEGRKLHAPSPRITFRPLASTS